MKFEPKHKPKREPKRSLDLICALRGCEKHLQPPSNYAGKHGLTEPFCSRSCAEEYYGVTQRVLTGRG
jgi:hypothetical protein